MSGTGAAAPRNSSDEPDRERGARVSPRDSSAGAEADAPSPVGSDGSDPEADRGVKKPGKTGSSPGLVPGPPSPVYPAISHVSPPKSSGFASLDS